MGGGGGGRRQGEHVLDQSWTSPGGGPRLCGLAEQRMGEVAPERAVTMIRTQIRTLNGYSPHRKVISHSAYLQPPPPH